MENVCPITTFYVLVAQDTSFIHHLRETLHEREIMMMRKEEMERLIPDNLLIKQTITRGVIYNLLSLLSNKQMHTTTT